MRQDESSASGTRAETAGRPHGYADLRQHITRLRQLGLLWEIDDPIDKDAELHPFVRWQFRGGIREDERRAFLFTNVVGAGGRRYDNAVLVGGLAASPAVYAAGLQCDVDEVGSRWERAYSHPIAPTIVPHGPVHDVVVPIEDHEGFAAFPIPISTPGFDNAPYLTSAHVITKDIGTGLRNVGHYRGQIKSPDTCGMFFSAAYKHGYMHWRRAMEAGQPLEAALVIGAPPVVSYAAVQKIAYGADEYALAGGLAGEPIQLVTCKTVDLEVPADAEIVLEGVIRTDYVEPEGPFGESHGYVHTRSKSPIFELQAITHRRDYIWTSFISQVTPSESSVMKKVGFEPMLEHFLRTTIGIEGVRRVAMHEPLTNLRKVIFVQFDFGTKQTEIWRALKAVASYRAEIGKVVVAVDEDIDPDNLDAVWWSIAYRSRPHLDVQIIAGQYRGHGPPFVSDPYSWEDSNLLINATLRFRLPPVSLPTKEFMERAKQRWGELADKYGLPELRPEAPWHGYVITEDEWTSEYQEEAQLAVEGRHFETGRKLGARREPTK